MNPITSTLAQSSASDVASRHDSLGGAKRYYRRILGEFRDVASRGEKARFAVAFGSTPLAGRPTIEVHLEQARLSGTRHGLSLSQDDQFAPRITPTVDDDGARRHARHHFSCDEDGRFFAGNDGGGDDALAVDQAMTSARALPMVGVVLDDVPGAQDRLRDALREELRQPTTQGPSRPLKLMSELRTTHIVPALKAADDGLYKAKDDSPSATVRGQSTVGDSSSLSASILLKSRTSLISWASISLQPTASPSRPRPSSVRSSRRSRFSTPTMPFIGVQK